MKGSKSFLTGLIAIAALMSTSALAIMALVGLKDDYQHDGRVLFEVLNDNAVLQGKQGNRTVIERLAEAYKDINAPVGRLGRKTFSISTAALNGDDATYTRLKAEPLIGEAEFLSLPSTSRLLDGRSANRRAAYFSLRHVPSSILSAGFGPNGMDQWRLFSVRFWCALDIATPPDGFSIRAISK